MKTEKEINDKISDIIGAYCPSCEKESCFTYIGVQEFDDVKLNMFNCDNEECCTTLTLDTILTYTRERIEQRILDYNKKER